MKFRRGFFSMIFWIATLTLFIVSGILSFFSSRWNEERGISESILGILARSYLDGVAERLGEDFNATFYQSIINDGDDFLNDAVEIASQTVATRGDTIKILAVLNHDEKDVGIEAALSFLSELCETESHANQKEIALPKWVFSIPAELEKKNPLDFLRSVSSDASNAFIPSPLLWCRQLAPMTNWSGWLFSLLSLLTAMTRSDGIGAVLTGDGRKRIVLFFSRLFHLASFIPFPNDGESRPTLSDAILPPNERLLEKGTVVLRC